MGGRVVVNEFFPAVCGFNTPDDGLDQAVFFGCDGDGQRRYARAFAARFLDLPFDGADGLARLISGTDVEEVKLAALHAGLLHFVGRGLRYGQAQGQANVVAQI